VARLGVQDRTAAGVALLLHAMEQHLAAVVCAASALIMVAATNYSDTPHHHHRHPTHNNRQDHKELQQQQLGLIALTMRREDLALVAQRQDEQRQVMGRSDDACLLRLRWVPLLSSACCQCMQDYDHATPLITHPPTYPLIPHPIYMPTCTQALQAERAALGALETGILLQQAVAGAYAIVSDDSGCLCA